MQSVLLAFIVLAWRLHDALVGDLSSQASSGADAFELDALAGALDYNVDVNEAGHYLPRNLKALR